MARSKEKVLLCALFLSVMFFLNVGAPILGSQSTQAVSSHGTISYPVSDLPGLHTSGTKIYDNSGREVRLWGVAIQSGAPGNHVFTLSDFQTMKNYGFNTVRFYLKWGFAQPNDGNPPPVNTAFFTNSHSSGGWQVDDFVRFANAVDMYVIISLDWTSYFPLPSWVVQGGLHKPEGGGTVDITNSKNLQAVAYLYSWMANRYYEGNNPSSTAYHNVIFEGVNEFEGTSSDMANWRAWNNNWITAIEGHEAGVSHLKIIEFLLNFNSGSVVSYLNAYPPYSRTAGAEHSNILLATHSYFLVRSSLGSPSSVSQQIYSACKSANVPWMDTEYSTAVSGDYNALQAASSAMAGNGIAGWGYYCYDTSSGNDWGGNWNVNNPSYTSSLLAILQPLMTQQ